MGKLIKYELRNSKKSVMQIVFIMMIATFVLQISIFSGINSVILGQTNYINNASSTNIPIRNILSMILPLFTVIAVLTLFGASIAYYFRMANILKNDIFEDVGYITFSIPKTGYQIIGAKIIVGVIWTLVLPMILLIYNIALGFLLNFIFSQNANFARFSNEMITIIKKGIETFIEITNLNIFALSNIRNLVGSVLFIIVVFASIIFDYTIGTRRKNSLRWIIWILLFYILTNTLLNFVLPTQTMELNYELTYSGSVIDNLFGRHNIYTTMSFYRLIVEIIFDILISIGLFMYTAYSFENKVEK